MDNFTIRDIENLSGIKAHTIRIWEQRYSFLKPRRTDTNIRYYTNEELRAILNIALLNKYGYRISHISRMSSEDIQQKILELNHNEAEQEKVVNGLILSMVALDMQLFETTLDRYIAQKGIERCINHVIFPFLERIGILWQTGHINPAQEHLVSNIVRQKLIVGIDQAQADRTSQTNFLLFLPEGEYHEMGLLFVHYLLKSRGIDVTYIGSNIPLKDVQSVVNIKRPDHIYIHLTSTAPGFNFDRFLNNMSVKFHDIPVIISGVITQGYRKQLPENITFKHSLSEVMDLIIEITAVV